MAGPPMNGLIGQGSAFTAPRAWKNIDKATAKTGKSQETDFVPPLFKGDDRLRRPPEPPVQFREGEFDDDGASVRTHVWNFGCKKLIQERMHLGIFQRITRFDRRLAGE